MKASYTSTGSGGTDYEVEVAAALFARLLAGGLDISLVPGLVPLSVSLQHRTGPLGFDDFTVVGETESGISATAYLQAKRSYSLGDNVEFRGLIASLWSHLQVDQGTWTATLVAGSVTPDIADIDALLESARAQLDWASFERVWSAKGALNAGKRRMLGAVRKTLAGLPPHAPFDLLRRLRVVAADFQLSASHNRQAVQDLLEGVAIDPSAATAILSDLRSIALEDGKLAGSYTRSSLIAALPSQTGFTPASRARAAVAALEKAGAGALASIVSHIGPPDGTQAGLSLLRTELVQEGRQWLDADGVVRIVGEGGAGKSAFLRRLADRFKGRALVLKDDWVDGQTWPAFANPLGVTLTADQVAAEFASQGPCLLAIDGADRLLLSERRPVVEALLAAIAASPLRKRWSIIASARDFQARDLVADALSAAGLPTGRRVVVSSVTIADVRALGQALPTLAAVAARSDLGDRNRILFLLREMLASPHLDATATEVQLAEAWATRGVASRPPDPHRDHALAQIGELLLTRPARRPGRADLDPEGLLSLEREEAVHLPAGRDVVLMSHDVHEDWLLARMFLAHQKALPALLRAAEEPLAWLRTMRVYGQALLEDPGGPSGWLDTVARFEAEQDLDPAWLRSLMVAPLYSERSAEMLDALEPASLADSGRLLLRLVETLLVSEFRLAEGVPEDPADAAPVQHRIPVLRSWAAFIRWSVTKWRDWPITLMPLLPQIAHAWCSFTQGTDWPITQAVVRASLALLMEIEDAQYAENWDSRRRPFGDTEYREWRKPAQLLRNAVARGAQAAPDEVRAYLERLIASPRLRSAAEDLIEHHGQIPVALAGPYTDLLIAHLTPRVRKTRHEGMIGYSDCFDIHGYHEAGIRDGRGFFPAAPDRGGFAALFANDEGEALRLFHRLEMRSSVYLRNYWRRGQRRPLRPLRLPSPDGDIPLWGNEHEYKWSRGVPGSNALGACYLALDDWLWAQLEAGRPIEELCRLVLQRNGLAATAAPLICAIALKAEAPGVIDTAAPFLGAPRLWDYDLQRFVSTQHQEHPMGFMALDRHFRAADAGWQRWRQRQFLANDLILRFHLQAGSEAKAGLEAARQAWSVADLATYQDELDDPERLRAFEERLVRIRSDADPASVSAEPLPEGEGVKIWIEPPAEQAEQTAKVLREHQDLDRVMTLMNWVIRIERSGALDDAMTLDQAINRAKGLQLGVGLGDDAETEFFRRRMVAAAIAGTAWAAARFGPDAFLDAQRDWIEETVLAACQTLDLIEADGMFVDEAVLTMDPLAFGAKGAAALLARGCANVEIHAWASLVAYSRLTEASAALLAGLDWKGRTRDSWELAVIALDRTVYRYARSWRDDREREASRVQRANARLFRQSLGRGRRLWGGPPTPRLPRATKRRRIYRKRQGRWPFGIGLIRTDWAFNWSRAGKLLDAIDLVTVAADPALAARLERYLRALADWTYAYADTGKERYGPTFPYEWSVALAKVLGRYAAATGAANLWLLLSRFELRDHGRRMVGDYLGGLTRALIDSGLPPDDRFWSAWRGAADWLLDQHGRAGRRGEEHVEEWATAAGFMGPYGTPLPDDWPHLDLLLPEVDRWAQVAGASASAARRLIQFASRFDREQNRRWLLPWAGLMVERRQGDRAFWGYGDMGDDLAALLEPLAATDADMRKDVRRLIAVIADSGSLGAREALARLAGRRGPG